MNMIKTKVEPIRKKHGIDFDEAQKLWDRRIVEIPLLTADEPRSMVIGEIDEKCYTAIITSRGKRIRIISVRRSRKNEREQYYE